MAIAGAELFDGNLALITNTPELTPDYAVARYKAFAEVERVCRILKSDIDITPAH